MSEPEKRPVFIVALPGGRGVDPTGRPLSSDGLGAFSREGPYQPGIRRPCLSILAHKPDSTIFEGHYNDPTVSVELLAVAYTEKQKPIENEAHPAPYRIQYSWTPAEEEKFLRAIIDQDPAYKSAKDAGERKRAAKNARYRGRLSMREQQRAVQQMF
ncbi:hypothetical protein OCU04_004428 [Sclerotinia nivalis]|uniref:Uncharacterized protein n=1 Tax=Sclerotinia nivalis TaxID=352851 RepID=A0A9X0ATS9_9HELO|nr:hypothetical protein OCU04_004428 [Sclerotinia nivalis]